MLYENLTVGENGHLYIGGADTVELAREYGTPAYILDMAQVRRCCRMYKRACARYLGDGSLPVYASKAFSCREIYRVMREEGMGVDCVSGG